MLFSRSYTGFYDPFTYTGAMTSLDLNDTWTVSNGIILGPDVFIGPAARASYIGGARWKPDDGSGSVQFNVLLTPGQYNVAEQTNMESYLDLVWTYRLSKGRICGGEALYAWQHGVPGIGLATWYGIQGYVRQSLTERPPLWGESSFSTISKGNVLVSRACTRR